MRSSAPGSAARIASRTPSTTGRTSSGRAARYSSTVVGFVMRLRPSRPIDSSGYADASASAAKHSRLYQADKQLLRLVWRVRDGLVDAGLHEPARRVERRGHGGVIDDPQLHPVGPALSGPDEDLCHERLANADAPARRLNPK